MLEMLASLWIIGVFWLLVAGLVELLFVTVPRLAALLQRCRAWWQRMTARRQQRRAERVYADSDCSSEAGLY